MKKLLVMIIAMVMILGFCIPCLADDWNASDTTLIALECIDWAQTRDIATEITCSPRTDRGGNIVSYEYSYKFKELNPILGLHPSLKKVNIYFSSCIICDCLVSKYSTPKFHKLWNTVGIALESYCITGNIRAGVNLKF